jgi:hypothetical protein
MLKQQRGDAIILYGAKFTHSQKPGLGLPE